MKEFGVVGLGRMGGGLGWQAMGKGYKVVGIDLHDPSADIVEWFLANFSPGRHHR